MDIKDTVLRCFRFLGCNLHRNGQTNPDVIPTERNKEESKKMIEIIMKIEISHAPFEYIQGRFEMTLYHSML